jgi:uncharacterized protein YneF (UPF0154 family)
LKEFFVNFVKKNSFPIILFFLIYNLAGFFISLQLIIKLMAKNYLYITFLLGFFFTLSVSAQEVKQQSRIQETKVIEGLSLYPNPASNGKIYITSKNDSDKEVIIFDVLGKKVLQAAISAKELNISALSPGVYIIKINEGDASTTRKLIVK